MQFKSFSKIISFPLLVLIIHTVLVAGFDIYHRWNWFDTPMHFVGGVSIALAAHFYLQARQEHGALSSLSKFDRFLFIVATVTLAAVLWEIMEFLGDNFFYHYAYSQLSNFDTMKDLIMGLSGGTLTAIFSKNNSLK